MQARSRYYPRLADAKLLLRLTACNSLSTEARLSTLHWHSLLHPLHYLLIVTLLRQLPLTYQKALIFCHSNIIMLYEKPEKRGRGGWRSLILPTVA